MNRLPFVLPDFTRHAWVSDEAKAYWEPIVSTIKARWSTVERETVYRAARAACITDCAPGQLSDLIVEAASKGCVAVPLDVTANRDGYAASSQPPQPGQLARQRVALTHPSAASSFLTAWREGDHDAIGAHLGFPVCCRAFFRQVWIADRQIDTTWRQARGQAHILGYFSEANVLGRWMGVRSVPHLPCAFDCESTVHVANNWRTVAHDLGYDDSWAAIEQITKWPVLWSALHGIAEIVTPVWKVIARTDATAGKLSVQVHGDEIPAYAATGIGFPYPTAVPTLTILDPSIWTDNGFSSREAMTSAHDAIVQAVKEWRPVPGPVLDLGCGNGALVRRLATGQRGGIEIDADKVARATGVDPYGAYVAGDLRNPSLWPSGDWRLTACMVGRLTEGDTVAASQALRRGPVVFYAYRDWLKAQPIEAMLTEVGHGDRQILAAKDADAVSVRVVA